MDQILAEPYQPRSVRFLELWEHEAWRVKVYGIAYGRGRPGAELLEAALARAARTLPDPAITPTRYGVGFLGVHDGRDGNLVFVDWWENTNELHHRPFIARPDQPLELRDTGASDPMGCVWDLAVLEFERTAWISNVLLDPARASFDAYLQCRFEGTI